jgi:hypothetical protein
MNTQGLWRELDKGLQRASVPRISDNQPEFAILQLTREVFAEFNKDPASFVNKHRIFSERVQDRVISKTASAAEDQGDYFYILVSHWPASKALCTIYEPVRRST